MRRRSFCNPACSGARAMTRKADSPAQVPSSMKMWKGGAPGALTGLVTI